MHSASQPEIPAEFSARLVPVFERIAPQLLATKKLIDEQFLSCPQGWLQAVVADFDRYVGKMFRPGLVILAGQVCGAAGDKHTAAGAIVELIHNATLLHDDVIDEGRIRRSRPTLNVLHGNECAVLVGDFLLSQALKMCSELKSGVIRVVALTTSRICQGELEQVKERKNWLLSESEYVKIITEKSASLFEGCCRIGVMLADACEEEMKRLAEFGVNLGIAFQIADDCVDIIGDEEKAGKTLGTDVAKGKVTLPLIYLLEEVDTGQKKKLLAEFEERSVKAGQFRQLLQATGSIERCRDKSKEYIERSKACLIGLKDCDARRDLQALANFVLGRIV